MRGSKNLSGCQVFDMSSTPADWECCPLGDRITLEYGQALPERLRKAGSTLVYGSNGRIGKHDSPLAPNGGLVVGRKGTVGAVQFTTEPLWPIDTTYYVVPKASDSLRFLYHLLRYLPLTLLNAATGVPGLSRRDAYALRGVFPPKAEQDKIVGVLDAADRATAAADSTLGHARALYRSMLHGCVHGQIGPGASNFGRWAATRLDAVADVGSGVTLGKDVSGRPSVDLPYLRVANVQDGHLDLSSIKTVRVPSDDVDRYRLESGDVLMTEGGDIDKLGRGTIWHGQIANCLHQNHIFRVRPNRALLDPEYYSLVVESDIAKRYFCRVAKRTTNLASTNKTQVRAFSFPLPPSTAEQEQIVAVMKRIGATVSALEVERNALRQLGRSLSHDLLTGRVRATSVDPVSVV